jgi:hypothetical protein
MKPGEYQQTLLIVAFMMASLRSIDVPAAIEAIGKAETVGPVLDPTLYRANGQKMAEDKAMLEAALPLWRLANTEPKLQR